MRAAREYLLAQQDFDPQIGEPYPMLLVRPQGIAAYYAARAAMNSWGSDFGYELVGDDWKLAYPPPDPRLAEVLRQMVASARIDQARLIAAAPRQYGRPKAYQGGAAHGSFVAEEGDDDGDDGDYGSQRRHGRAAVSARQGSPAAAMVTGGRHGTMAGPGSNGLRIRRRRSYGWRSARADGGRRYPSGGSSGYPDPPAARASAARSGRP